MNHKIESEMNRNKDAILRIGKDLKDLGVSKMQIKGIKTNTINLLDKINYIGTEPKE